MPRDSAINGPEGGGPLADGRAPLQAVTRLLRLAADLSGPEAVRDGLVGEARQFFGITRAVLLALEPGRSVVRPVAVSPEAELPQAVIEVEVEGSTALRAVMTGQAGPLVMEGEDAARLDVALGAGSPARTLLAVPLGSGGEIAYVLVLADAEGRRFGAEAVEIATLFAAAASASLVQMRVAEDYAGQSAHQAALARAARTLNESLDLNRVLVRICHEAASILDGDIAVVYRGDGSEGVTVEAAYGLPPEAIGYRIPPGQGLAGRVAEIDQPLLTNDYPSLARQPDRSLFDQVGGAVAVPMHWDGALRGVLSVGFRRGQRVTGEHLSQLEAFGDLAAAACRNASVHAGLAQAARTDGLTGCLNHAAMHDSLRREVERCERTGHRLSLVLVDMDDFKQVNEMHGHLMGDEVLRRVGRALKHAVRPYDMVARYGGDEFAIVAVESDEQEATELAGRSLSGVVSSLEELPEGEAAGGASAGIAEWSPGESSTALIERADRALMYGKHERGPGSVVPASELPGEYSPPPSLREAPAGGPPALPVGGWPARSGGEQAERLGRRTRQLAIANVLGARLAGMTHLSVILRTAVDELQRALGYRSCAVVRVRDDGLLDCPAGHGEPFASAVGGGWTQPRSAGLIGRCLRERRPVISEEPEEITRFAGAPEPANNGSWAVQRPPVGWAA